MFNWDDSPELNITPLVDVMLVLLAILMVTAPTMVYEELIQLPQGSKESPKKSQNIEVRITKSLEVSIEGKKFEFKTFADKFMLYSEKYEKDAQITITADERILYKDVMYILKSIKSSGFHKVSLSTN
jgi:biopolymer transport protein ExbD